MLSPGIIVAGFVLIAAPELFRELEAYRMLAFGAIMTIMMIIKPEGLIPASRRITQTAELTLVPNRKPETTILPISHPVSRRDAFQAIADSRAMQAMEVRQTTVLYQCLRHPTLYSAHHV